MNSRNFSNGQRVFTNAFFKSKSQFVFSAGINKSSNLFASMSNKLFMSRICNFQAIPLNRLSILQLSAFDPARLTESLAEVDETSSWTEKEMKLGNNTVDNINELVRTITITRHATSLVLAPQKEEL